jgi:hypothetical protein
MEIAPEPLNELADQAEALTPILDVYQINLSDDGDLIVSTFMRSSEASKDATQNIRQSSEAIWEAAMQADIDVSQVSVTFLRTQNVVSLEYGPTQAAWMVGGIRAGWEEITEYLTGPRTPAAQEAFWNGGEIIIVPFDRAFTGQPNHPCYLPKSEGCLPLAAHPCTGKLDHLISEIPNLWTLISHSCVGVSSAPDLAPTA